MNDFWVPTQFWTPAHFAVERQDAETLARLLATGSDPNEVQANLTLLTHAIDVEGDSTLQSGCPLAVHTTAILLAFAADPELAAPDGMTPMQMAEYYDHTLAIDLLRRHISERAPKARTARPARGVLPDARLWAL
ncbi:ankyrin repeat domain-containing protein [Streptomyces sp. BV129]|uniref:ankyrin repeat domain-containing protein n=1 Tax=Streptomyces sp. BV129 TaxID=2849671 RepID=UPI0027E52751|nr:ankyrin repeat domain-containing protein [Streptomyces sp. BV129]